MPDDQIVQPVCGTGLAHQIDAIAQVQHAPELGARHPVGLADNDPQSR
jgi:hypothetical protein